MHGSFFVLFKRYVTATYDAVAWADFLRQIGLAEDPYELKAVYPDEEFTALLRAAAQHAACPEMQLHERFGEFLVPDLLYLYRSRIQPEWRTMDLLEHTEPVLHSAARREAPGIQPPVLHCEQLAPGKVRVRYESSRRMGGLAVGIIRGLARYFGEENDLRITLLATPGSGEQVEILVEDTRVSVRPRRPAPTPG